MAISVYPSGSVTVDIEHAEPGDLIKVTLEDDTVLYLRFVVLNEDEKYPVRYFVIDPRWMPDDFAEEVEQLLVFLIKNRQCRESFMGRQDKSQKLDAFVRSLVTSNMRVVCYDQDSRTPVSLDVGRTISVRFSVPGVDLRAFNLENDSCIRSIGSTTEFDAETDAFIAAQS